MTYHRHSLSIGLERVDHEFFVYITATGTLTHQDYEIITPLLDAAIAKVNTPQVNVLVDITRFEGWELRAAWDDFKLGLTHGSDFNKVALYGDREWQALMAKVADWFSTGEVRYFENYDHAVRWLQS
ncbi:STAS/SEC14 domain-containing protein [Vibrio quintilis]|uniref:STAS/SEC14 domain-containing protein n=1 Tax=Vibrio quintilis TaxID=1117707 RepID=A0A1M7YWR3_9VIBR|nr:STAS/SEC14 domain-containing protein [Vibrio quintilis]SHO56953.1 hypothetical protein VQ7734_02722 [Vibrio quintilis]